MVSLYGGSADRYGASTLAKSWKDGSEDRRSKSIAALLCAGELKVIRIVNWDLEM